MASELLTVPNFSVGADAAVVEALTAAAVPLRLITKHSDDDHGRTVLTLAGEQGRLGAALARLAVTAADRVELAGHTGIHPHVGVLDVAPVVYLRTEDRGAACAEALVAAYEIAACASIPVFLYGELAAGRERSELRAGGVAGLTARMATGEQTPDFGPAAPHPTAGATLVAARPPLVAFNLELATGQTEDDAKAVAAGLRESGGGPRGVRAIGLWLASRGVAQVSCNVHDPLAVPLARIVAHVRERASVAAAELVGLAPAAAFEGFPDDLPVRNFDSATSLIENVLQR